MIISSYKFVFPQFTSSFYVSFLSRVYNLINFTNWPASNVWIFIAHWLEYCGANAEAMGSNPVEAPVLSWGGGGGGGGIFATALIAFNTTFTG